MSSIKALLLDADGVLQRTPSGWLTAVRALCTIPAERDPFLKDLFNAEQACLRGQADFRATLAGVLQRWNSPVPVAEALALWTQIVPEYEILETVQAVRQAGIRTALATNQNAVRANHMRTALDYQGGFDQLFFSCEIGHTKPSDAFFEAVIDRLQLKPEHLLFIDDHEENCDAARHCGLKACRYRLEDGRGHFRTALVDHGVAIP
ncbi:MAG: HAD-IA family hydrolase [Pseudomonadota bacterium]